MWVQCVLCDRYIEISDEAAVAKRFKKRPDYAFLCSHCGGGLGKLELNETPPGVLPDVLAASGREASPAFAAWSEPTKPRLRHHRSEGGAPLGEGGGREAQPARENHAALREVQPLPRPARDQQRQPQAEEEGQLQGGMNGRPARPQQLDPGLPYQPSQAGSGQPEPGQAAQAGQEGGGRHRRRRGRSGKPHGPGAEGNGAPNNGNATGGSGTGAGQNGQNGHGGQGRQGGQGQQGQGRGQRGRGGGQGGQNGQGNGQGRGPRNGGERPRGDGGERRPPALPQAKGTAPTRGE